MATESVWNAIVPETGETVICWWLLMEKTNYVGSLTGMPQTKAVAPFKAPIDEEKIKIDWLPYTDEWGNKFADGESYSLIYPEVTIPEDAYYVPLEDAREIRSPIRM